jgi:uncharacterized Fe-S cluster-containing protein
MTQEEAHSTIITGYKRYRREGRMSVHFAVFLEHNDDVSVLHMTDRRSEILNKDLASRDGPIREKFVGLYNKAIVETDFFADIAYVKEVRDGGSKRTLPVR